VISILFYLDDALNNLRDQEPKISIPLHSLEDDVDTVKREISLIGGPVTFVEIINKK
jgi:hypothetical protein